MLPFRVLRTTTTSLARPTPFGFGATTTRTISRAMSSATDPPPSNTPVEDTIRSKITTSLTPTNLQIHNDSSQHAHHTPVLSLGQSWTKETHFRLFITSPAFEGKNLPARHRMVHALLKDELAREGGIHALQLKTLTPAEEEKKAQEAGGA